MYSITYSIGYMLVVLLSYVSTSDYPFNVPRTVSAPYYFGYKTVSNIILSLDVTLKNIPTSVTYVSVIRYTYDNYYKQGPFMTTVNVKVDKKTREGEFIILENVKNSQTWFDVELYKRTGLCNTFQIIEGRFTFYNYGYYWDTTQSTDIYYNDNTKYVSNGYCFASNVCKMVVDLSEVCEDHQVSNNHDLMCDKEKSQYVCTFVQGIMNDINVVIYQTSEENTTIEPLLVFKARGSLYLYFNFELFDNNTFVKLEATSSQNDKTTKSYKITVNEKDINEVNGDVKIQKYSEAKNYKFSCEEYNNTYSEIFVGVINTTDNKIIKTVTHKTRMNIKMEDNGTMLCCILYDKRDSQEITITRSVKNKTLLIYQSHESMTTNRPETDELTKLLSSGSNWWIYLIPIISVTVLMVIIYLIIKRCCHKLRTNSRPAGGTEELNENTNTNQVLYAKLDFGVNDNQTEKKIEESEYATIVGVVQPFGNGRA